MSSSFDALVIGSGIGGLAAAVALGKAGRRVLVLERHSQAGGLTQTFERDGFRFDVGVHYLGGFGAGQVSRDVFESLVGDRIAMAPIAGAFDRVSFPGCSLALEGDASRGGGAVLAAFPEERAGLARYAEAVNDAQHALQSLFVAHCAPPIAGSVLTMLKRRSIERWVERTTQDVVAECVTSPHARAVLSARWGDYGTPPSVSSFALHAAVMTHYRDGAWYPVGGAGTFARVFGEAIAAQGGEIRTGADVVAIDLDHGAVTGVQLADGTHIACDCVVSDIGLHNTMRRLPSLDVDYRWASEAFSISASAGFIALYLGLEGDIAARGATPANEWVYDTWDVDALWNDPASTPAPSFFVAFPSLRDPAHQPGPRRRHTCKVLAPVDWSVFAPWDRSGTDDERVTAARRDSYRTFKARIEQQLLAQFAVRYPDIAPCVKVVESSTPVSMATMTGAEHGAMVGLEASPRRFLAQALRPRTPVRGLYLAGQDTATPGVVGAAMGGLMAAAAVEPSAWKLLRHP